MKVREKDKSESQVFKPVLPDDRLLVLVWDYIRQVWPDPVVLRGHITVPAVFMPALSG